MVELDGRPTSCRLLMACADVPGRTRRQWIAWPPFVVGCRAVKPGSQARSVAEGKQTLEIEGRQYLIELALKADFSLIRAKRADYLGNRKYALTARNFNPLMAMAADKTIAEAEDIVPVGVIPPDVVVTPGVLVHCLVGAERTR